MKIENPKTSIVPFDFFAFRIPTYSINNYSKIKCDVDYIDVFNKDLILQECIFISSPTLYKSIISQEFSNREAVNNSIKNYYKRISNRATPFGGFAGFTTGRFSSVTRYKDTFAFVPRCRVSFIWLFRLIDKIEDNFEYIKNVNIISNSNIYSVNDRLYMHYSFREDKKNDSKKISILSTIQINFILKMCKSPIKLSSLAEKLIKKFGLENNKKIEDLVHSLIKHGFLLTNLRTNATSLESIIEIISSNHTCESLVKSLKDVNLNINKYNSNKKSGDNLGLLLKIVELMSNIQKCDEYIQIDTQVENLDITLDKRIGYEVCEAYEWLWNNMYFENIEVKKEKELLYDNFVEHYGENVKIPFKTLLLNGLGVERYCYKENHNSSVYLNEIGRDIYKRIIECYINNDIEIIVDNIKNRSLNKKITNESFEIYGHLYLTENKDFEFIVNNTNMGGAVGQSFGRFVDIIEDKKLLDDINKFYSDKDYVPVNIFFHSQNYKWNNVMTTSSISEYNLYLNLYNTNKGIDIDDIYLIASNNKIFLWSKLLKKKIKLVKMHMLNPMNMPKVLQILVRLSEFNNTYSDFFSFFIYLNSLVFSPRIKYKNVVLKLATWSIHKNDFNGGKNKWLDYFNKFRDKYNMTKYVNLIIGDNKLLINTDELSDKMYLYKELKNNNIVFLEEVYGVNNNLKEKNGEHYFSEIIIPVRCRKENLNLHNNINTYELNQEFFLLGENYIYVKIYTSIDKMNIILLHYIFPIMKKMLKNNHIEEFFFIRYNDGKPHIRVRLKGEKEGLLEYAIPLINTIYRKLYRENLSNNIQFDTYRPEKARYGGGDYIGFVEEYFYYDSIFALNTLYNIEILKLDIPIESILVKNFILMFENIGISYEETCRLIDINDTSKIKVINYREYEHSINQLFFEINNLDHVDEKIKIIIKIIEHKFEKVKLNNLNKIQDRKYLFNIIQSLIHMTCNRFDFSSKLFEIKTRELLRRYLRILKYRKEKHDENNKTKF